MNATDIKPYVETIIKALPNFISAYQILEELPVEIRDQVIAHHGMPGHGGGAFNAAGLVAMAAGMLVDEDTYEKVFCNMAGVTFTVKGQTIAPGGPAIAFYRKVNAA